MSKLKLRDKFKQLVCKEDSSDPHYSTITYVYSESTGKMTGKTLDKHGNKVRVCYDEKSGAWLYE